MIVSAIKKWITKDFLSGSVTGLLVMAFIAGMSIYPYTKIPNKVTENTSTLNQVKVKTEKNSNDIKAIRKELQSIDRTMRIIACSDREMAQETKRFLNCSDFG